MKKRLRLLAWMLTLTMLCAGMAGIFLVLGVLVLGVYLLNKVFQKKDKQ